MREKMQGFVRGFILCGLMCACLFAFAYATADSIHASIATIDNQQAATAPATDGKMLLSSADGRFTITLVANDLHAGLWIHDNKTGDYVANYVGTGEGAVSSVGNDEDTKKNNAVHMAMSSKNAHLQTPDSLRWLNRDVQQLRENMSVEKTPSP